MQLGGNMQFFDRAKVPPPSELQGSAARVERLALLDLMRENSNRRAQSLPERRFEFGDETRQQLAVLFQQKCAFCESKRTMHIHHFRPQSDADPYEKSEFAHLYYTWLRTDWNNVYPACEKCATSAGRFFPVRPGGRGALPAIAELEHFANENYGVWRWPHRDKPWLLDPCKDRSFITHFSFGLDGAIKSLSRAGAETVSAFALDRDDLTAARARAFDDYLDHLRHDVVINAVPVAFNFPMLEFGGAWYLLLRRIAACIAERLDIRLDGNSRRLAKSYRRVMSTPIGRDAFERALEEVRQPAAGIPAGPQRTRGAPRLIAVHLANFKALESIDISIPEPIPEDVEAGRDAEASAVLVLGENAAGKSSLLEALALSLCGPMVRQRLGKAPSSFVLNPDMMGLLGAVGPEHAKVVLEFHDGSTRYLRISDRFDEGDHDGPTPSIFAYGAFRQYAADAKRTRRFGKVGTLFQSSIILPNPEQWLLGLDRPQFAMVARALHRLFSVEGDFNVIEQDKANSRCLIVTQIGTGSNVKEMKTPLSVVSSGFRSVLAMVCDIFEGLLRDKTVSEKGFAEAEPIILIDEIEAHLHPRWKMQIMAAFRRVLPKAIFIATTHDPLCLRGMHDREVLVLSRVEREDADLHQVPVIVETLAELPNVENLTIEQLLTSDFFAMFSTDSPDAERKLAELGSLLARRAAGARLNGEETRALEYLEHEVATSLPLGSSEVQRLVQKAVAVYLQRRRDMPENHLARLEVETRDLIVNALEGF